jgi:hypothetical protein
MRKGMLARWDLALSIGFALLLLIRCDPLPTSGGRPLPTPSVRPLVPSEEGRLATPAAVDDVYVPLAQKDPPWAGCEEAGFGTMLIQLDPDDGLTPADVLLDAHDRLGVRGMAGAGAPSDLVRDEWFGRLPGWTRLFLRGTYDQLGTIHEAAMLFGMEEMYECFGYGPESAHGAGEEALEPRVWVPQAEAVAEAAGKCLVYGPAVRDYEYLAELEGLPDPSPIVADCAPHVDVWMVQLAKYQSWVDAGKDEDGDPYTWADFRAWIGGWVSWIKTANPDAQVWTQLGIGRWDPLAGRCLEPQPPEYLLDFREVLTDAGVDGVWVMPSQSCMPCPPEAPPGFVCSSDPQDNDYYRQSLGVFQQAMELVCGD